MTISFRAALVAALLLGTTAHGQDVATTRPATRPTSRPATRPTSKFAVRPSDDAVVRAVLHVKTARINRIPKMGSQVQSADWLQEAEFRSMGTRADGALRVQTTFGHGRLKYFHPILGELLLDSRNPVAPDQVPPMILIGASYYLGYIGQTLTFVLNDTGRIIEVEGEEQIQKNIAALGQTEAAKRLGKGLFEYNGVLFYEDSQIRRFLQPFFPQTPKKAPAAGASWVPESGYYLFTGAKNVPPVEWPAKADLAAVSDDDATITWSGGTRVVEPYFFEGDKRDRREGTGERDRDSSAATRPATDGKAHVVEKKSAGVGRLSLKDGLWNELSLRLDWIDDKPEYSKDSGAQPKDEYRHDRTQYAWRRVTEFATTWTPLIPDEK